MKAHSWKKINNFRKHTFKTLIMEAFEEYEETKSQNLTHRKLSDDQESKFQYLTHEKFSEVSGRNIFESYSWKILQKCQDITCSKGFHGNLSTIAGNNISKYNSWIFFKLQEELNIDRISFWEKEFWKFVK